MVVGVVMLQMSGTNEGNKEVFFKLSFGDLFALERNAVTQNNKYTARSSPTMNSSSEYSMDAEEELRNVRLYSQLPSFFRLTSLNTLLSSFLNAQPNLSSSTKLWMNVIVTLKIWKRSLSEKPKQYRRKKLASRLI